MPKALDETPFSSSLRCLSSALRLGIFSRTSFFSYVHAMFKRRIYIRHSTCCTYLHPYTRSRRCHTVPPRYCPSSSSHQENKKSSRFAREKKKSLEATPHCLPPLGTQVERNDREYLQRHDAKEREEAPAPGNDGDGLFIHSPLLFGSGRRRSQRKKRAQETKKDTERTERKTRHLGVAEASSLLGFSLCVRFWRRARWERRDDKGSSAISYAALGPWLQRAVEDVSKEDESGLTIGGFKKRTGGGRERRTELPADNFWSF